MDNELELKELVEGYRDLVGQCIDRVDELESMIMDGILNPVRQEMERAELKQKKDAFINEIGDKLSVFDKKLRLIEGNPDFSLNDIAFEQYDSLEVPEGKEKPTPTEFADVFAEETSAKIDKYYGELMEAFNEAETKEDVADVAEKAEEVKDAIDEAVADKKEEVVEGESVTEEKVEEKVAEPKEEIIVTEEGEELTDEDKEELERMKENLRKAMGVYGK